MSIEAMKQALEALEYVKQTYDEQGLVSLGTNTAIIDLRQAIAEAEKQEPYGYLKLSNGKFYVEVVGVPDLDCNPDYLPLHTYPQPKQEQNEPVAVVDVHEFYDNCANFSLLQKLSKGKHTLYTTPQQRKPLTDEQIYDMYNEPRSDAEMLAFARSVEAAHGIKEKNI